MKKEKTTKSPCIGVCQLNSNYICTGCGRNIDEIKNWKDFSDEEKIKINEIVEIRLDILDED